MVGVAEWTANGVVGCLNGLLVAIRVVLAHRCHIHVIPRVSTSALLRVGISIPGVVMSRWQHTPHVHRVVLVRWHLDRLGGSCGNGYQLGLDGRRNSCQSQSISSISGEGKESLRTLSTAHEVVRVRHASWCAGARVGMYTVCKNFERCLGVRHGKWWVYGS